jgi:hypothetical protein
MVTTPQSSPRAVRFAAPLAALLVLIAALAVPATSFAQATRTWISGTGDDVNPCSRTAPCKTWAGAISKTAAGGEIDALDPGGFGTLTVTKSITISGVGTQASVLASGVNAFTIQAAPTDRVTITNIAMNGINGTVSAGLDGVKIISAATVRLENDNIFDFAGNGVNFASNSPTGNPQSRLIIENSTIEGNGAAGVLVLPTTSVGERASILGSHIDDNGCGVTAGGTCTATTGSGFPVITTTIGSSIIDNGTGAGTGASGNGAGIQSVGSTAASAIGGDQILGNTIGLNKVTAGGIYSFGDNDVFGNNTNGTPTSTITKESRIWTIVSRRAQAIAKAKRTAKKKSARR